jgi:hypothetical protein
MKIVSALLAVVLLCIGSSLIAYSSNLSPYKDEKAFSHRYRQMNSAHRKEFNELRAEFVTPKFALQDRGVTAVLLALGVFLTSRFNVKQLPAPKSRAAFVTLSVLIPFTTVIASMFHLVLGDERGEVPGWDDSTGHGMMGMPFVFVALFFWAFVHLGFLRSEPNARVPLALAFSRQANLWLKILSTLAVGVIGISIWHGCYWYFLSGLLWLYFYLSLAARREAARQAFAEQRLPLLRAQQVIDTGNGV